MNHESHRSPNRWTRILVLTANVIFAAAFIVAILGHWQLALVVIGVGLIPAIAGEIARRMNRKD